MNGFIHPTDAVRDAVEEIEGAVHEAASAAGAMVDSLRMLAAAVPGTETARQATALAASWAADAAAWSRGARELGEALEADADDRAVVEEALAASFGR
ncbi:hypothetical protein LQ327_07385 [Actinomycetospora endophytica]|uniref:Excreted virulence factor EspC (Type VII ESX diderm) n=1 Tax=Actinomycetospora endophytica TaxID=2291215 RepID=A0ABS8P4N2_9PSEU|nr:hypothetical protein [Actinomycetospora endophytica]MCD2193208.1 hypothetical protein [Actinomycetospora endophytica]